MFLVADASPWLQVLGRAHPLVLHVPIGVCTALAVLELGGLVLRRPPPRGVAFVLALLLAASAALAAVSGLVLAAERRDSELLGQHKLLGIGFGVACVLLPFVALRRRAAPFRIVLLVAVAAMLPTGHFGGMLTHGRNFLFGPLQPKTEPPPPVAPQGVFATAVLPMLKRTCTSCHNPDDLEGDLDLTTRAAILKEREFGPVVVPGDPGKSPLLERCLLPLDDDDHMPPADEPQPTAAELAVLRLWILAGAPE
jgi:uncharacterized membrane protein